jgi:hypothetical protein
VEFEQNEFCSLEFLANGNEGLGREGCARSPPEKSSYPIRLGPAARSLGPNAEYIHDSESIGFDKGYQEGKKVGEASGFDKGFNKGVEEGKLASQKKLLRCLSKPSAYNWNLHTQC